MARDLEVQAKKAEHVQLPEVGWLQCKDYNSAILSSAVISPNSTYVNYLM
jgi:hypothetical protein